MSGLTAAAAVSELARGCRWKCWCVLLFWVVWCPGGQGIFGRDRARLVGGGAVPRGDLSREFLPECNVTLIATWRCGNPEGVWNCWQYQAERWAQTWAQRLMSLMIGGISGCFFVLEGRGCWWPVMLQVLHIVWSKLHFILSFKAILDIRRKKNSPQSPFSKQTSLTDGEMSLNFETELLRHDGGEAFDVLWKNENLKMYSHDNQTNVWWKSSKAPNSY